MTRGRPKGSKNKFQVLDPSDPTKTTIGGRDDSIGKFVDPSDEFWDRFSLHINAQLEKDNHIMGTLRKLNDETIPEIMKHLKLNNDAIPEVLKHLKQTNPSEVKNDTKMYGNWFA